MSRNRDPVLPGLPDASHGVLAVDATLRAVVSLLRTIFFPRLGMGLHDRVAALEKKVNDLEAR